MGQRIPSADIRSTGLPGILSGTLVLTLDGEVPVQFLCPGDRIITRSGARVLRGVEMRIEAAPVLAFLPKIAAMRRVYALHFDGAETVYAGGRELGCRPESRG